QGNYRLAAGSPCIDAGHPDPVYNDLDGSINDIGAFGGSSADTSIVVGDGITLHIPTFQVAPGDTIQVCISGNNLNGVADLSARVSFAPNILSYLNTRTTELTHGFCLKRNVASRGIIDFTISSPLSIQRKQGDILTIDFAVDQTAVANSSSNISFVYAQATDEVAYERTISRLTNGMVMVTWSTEVEEESLVPWSYKLLQNYPNPFNPTTTIQFELPKATDVHIVVYDLLGREVVRLADRHLEAGHHQLVWNGRDRTGRELPTGMYIGLMVTPEYSHSIKMLLLK
ncbi:MAG: FlgD immunoglobulin-like domain containing protein, partial [Candidatus Neomarinimicrobiota bacterium]